MKQEYFFKNAKWLKSRNRTYDGFSVLRGNFRYEKFGKVMLNVLGLGFFKCYINGECINPDTFLPLSSEYEPNTKPVGEVLSGHRVYVPEFDITHLCKEGENVIDIHYGGGWYTNVRYGLPKAIYRISVETANGEKDYVSDENCLITESYVNEYEFVAFEKHDYRKQSSCFELDNVKWENAEPSEPLDTEYCKTDCPPDALIEKMPISRVGIKNNAIVYDCGKNISGYPVLELNAAYGEEISVYFSEELSSDGGIDHEHSHRQVFGIVSDGKKRIVQPEFTWYGFRYFEIVGNATPQCVKFVHADVPVTSSFECDNETINWIYKTFLHTMQCNMHTGHPSDCPHLERRGYTGDGQLTCHTVFTVMDAEKFYKKWLQDIADGQDTLSGHIQYTAPYVHSGGGPGGWGIAIIEVPYQLYKHYGDDSVLKTYYNNMRRYIDYLDTHSEFGLVTTDKEGEWCLGDWCGPVILYPDKDITSHDQQVMLPAAMVNTYFAAKSLDRLAEIANIIGKQEDIPEYSRKAEQRKKAISAAYFNAFDNNFIMNVQGANAYAVDIGLGNKQTYLNMVDYYKKLGHYDTGIFATDILTRILFENGDGELAVDLLCNNGDQGFEHWRRNGATTFHEYWDSNRSRSHNHPMFGAVVAYLFEYLLGIGQVENTCGYNSLVINPQAVSKFNRMSGSINTPNGKVAVQYEKNGDGYDFKITVPSNTNAVFKYNEKVYSLISGENDFIGLK